MLAPPAILRTLRRDDDEGKLFAGRDQFGRAVLLQQFSIVAPFTSTVQKQQQRPLLLLGIIFRQVEQVVQFDVCLSIKLLPLLLSSAVLERMCCGGQKAKNDRKSPRHGRQPPMGDE